MSSNQGRDLDQLLNDVAWPDIRAATDALWIETHRHPAGASCECPTLEALAVLYERGYRLVLPGTVSYG
jgi:3-deoxy-D-manno-octulosonic acid (KDO) 8-phosphate synthase